MSGRGSVLPALARPPCVSQSSAGGRAAEFLMMQSHRSTLKSARRNCFSPFNGFCWAYDRTNQCPQRRKRPGFRQDSWKQWWAELEHCSDCSSVTARLYFLSRISEHARSYSNSPFAGSFTRRHVKYVTFVCETFHLLRQVVCNMFFQGAIVPPC